MSTTVSAVEFAKTARSLASRLAPYLHDPQAASLARRAKALAAEFDAWKPGYPAYEVRAELMRQLMDLQRIVLLDLERLRSGHGG